LSPKVIFYIFISILITLFIKLLIDYFRKEKIQNKPIKKSMPILESNTPKAGVKVDTLRRGDGPEAVNGKTVHVHYNAWLTNGKKVDSSYDKGEIFVFTLGKREVIPGWEAGMIGMKKGEMRRFTIEPSQAYGEKGKANVPPNATIIFELELLDLF
jgi:FKBP-type peptidyl-prolyl cis-trans isomerase